MTENNRTTRQLRALHEAAHAVACESFGWIVRESRLEDKREVVQGVPSTVTGYTEAKHPKPSRENIGLFVAVGIAAYGAIRRLGPDAILENVEEAGLDWVVIRGYFEGINLAEGHRLAAFYEGVAEAEAVLNNNVKAIDRVATVLDEKSRISGDDVRRILQEEKTNTDNARDT